MTGVVSDEYTGERGEWGEMDWKDADRGVDIAEWYAAYIWRTADDKTTSALIANRSNYDIVSKQEECRGSMVPTSVRSIGGLS